MFGKIKASLTKTREGVFSKINRIVTGKRKIDEDLLEEIEEILITGDVGVETSLHVLDNIRKRVKKEKYQSSEELDSIIIDEVKQLLEFEPLEPAKTKPQVIFVVGVNGTGKTTSIAKLTNYYKNQGKTVLLAAADTFRAAAIEQLSTWGERLETDVIKHHANADPAAVVFDACEAALARKSDVLIIDTAGRLHTKVNLMSELEKMYRVIERQISDGPHETILVLDAGNGQNAVNQAREFIKTAKVNSIFLTKLDGTAKGGVVLGIKRELGIPVRYIGLGEKVSDMEIFNPEEFVEGLFGK
ncbi:MAG: signal recognition particle-docking protein FtsY [Calditrichaeota bacterium]|nr:MAG: signal recognition particle-docking protein FtsY [Calditrichota bacterium]MBL1204460.1 signal recognition particle-docking protein FtsY [Calditrichota bacterium]NOG44289.1 signal recognition particle-docking protein FtsY [Calditrichota bacterium]